MNIREILAAALGRTSPAPAPPPPEMTLQEALAVPMSTPAPAASPTPEPGAGAGLPAIYTDPFAQAQALERRQGAMAGLAAPASPVLELPQVIIDALVSLGLKEAAKQNPRR